MSLFQRQLDLFRLFLRQRVLPDFFGGNKLARALRLVDSLFEDTTNPEQTLLTVKEQRGHLAGTYLKLLRFLVERETGLRYSWAEPESERPSSRAVSQSEAGPLIEALSSVTNLGSESNNAGWVTFERFNRGDGSWGLLTNEGKRWGKVKVGGPSLDGLEVGGRL